MRYFVCVFDPHGQGIPESLRRQYEALPRARGLEFVWYSFSHAGGQSAVLTAWDDPWGDPLLTCDGQHLAVGMVRLDNRVQLEAWAEPRNLRCTDLEQVRRVVAEHGTRYIPRILGDFAVVIWDGAARRLVAFTDAFAVKKLYYSHRGGHLAFASRAEALAVDDRYELQHLAELVAGCVLSPDLTVYEGVRQLPPGTLAVGEHGGLAMRRYWSPTDFRPDPGLAQAGRQAAETCRELLAASVRLRLGPAGTTWAQLSGGLDSSSVVSTAQWMAERGVIADGLAGTVTYVDREGTDSDERRYSDPVVARWGVRNETIVEPPLWFDGDAPPPHTDQPRHALAFYPRERRILAVVRASGGRVLLTGFAGDELFTGTMLFFADWVIRGRALAAMREIAHRAAIGRTSFWELLYGNAVLPLLPSVLRHQLFRNQYRIRPWVAPAAIQKYRLRERSAVGETYAGPLGSKYHHAMSRYVTEISQALNPGFLGEGLDVRHPYLYRPLVEFALQLPPELCVRPQARKWVLREAMQGILPDVVRTRIGKGGPSGAIAWSLTAQRQLLDHLIRRPLLAELGLIDAEQLRAALDAAAQRPHRGNYLHTVVESTLLIEAWLQVRSDRWPPKTCLRSTVSEMQ